MTSSNSKADFTRIPLKYKSLEAFSKAARVTFAKGRMTLKSKKDLEEGERIMLAVGIGDRDQPVEIIAEVIQKVVTADPAESNTYGVRWLNFTEKKLNNLEAEGNGETPPPAPKPAPSPLAPAPPSPPPAAPEPPKKKVVKKKTSAPAPETTKAMPAPAEPAKTPLPPAPEPAKPPAAKKAAPPPPPPPAPAPPPPAPAAPKPKKADPVPNEAEGTKDEGVSSLTSEELGYTRLSDQFDLDGLLEEMERKSEQASEPAAPEAEPSPPEEDVSPAPAEIEADTSLDVQPMPEASDEKSALPAAEQPPEIDMFDGPGEALEAEPPPEIDMLDGPNQSLEPESPPEIDMFDGPAEVPEPEPEMVEPGPAEDLFEMTPEAVEPARAQEPEPELEPEPGPAPFSSDDDVGVFDDEMAALGDGPGAGAELSDDEILSHDDIGESEVSSMSPDEGEALGDDDETLPAGDDIGLDDDESDAAMDDDGAGADDGEPGPDDAKPDEPELPTARLLSEEALESLGIFLQKLLKLMIKPDKALAAKDNKDLTQLYEEFKTVMETQDEIVIYLRSAGATREYMLASTLSPPVNLKNALPPDQFDALAVKLVDFFTAKGLVGIQFRRYLSEDAFRQFVVRMGRYNPSKDSPEELAAGLMREGVFHVSPVHQVDRIAGTERLDFRVDLILARLRGDLKRTPLAAEAMGEDPEALWTLRVEDALKALSNGELRAEVLIRAARVVEGQDLITASDLVQEIVLATSEEMVVEAGDYLAGRYEDLFSRRGSGAAGGESEQELEDVKQALRQVTAKLLVERPESGARIMYDLYRKEVFTLEELPPELRERAMLDQFIDFFLQDPDRRLADFNTIKDLRNYRIASQRYGRMVAEMVRRGQVAAADAIFRNLVEHIKDPAPPFPERPRAAREAFNILAEPESLAALIDSLAGSDKEHRDKLAALIYAAGPKAAGPLIDLLETNEDRSLRRLLCQVLTRYGDKVSPTLAERIKDLETPWYLARNLIMIMGDIKSDLLRNDLDRLAAHPHPRVREEILVYAAKVLGTESEPLFVRALSDPEPMVRRRSVRVLTKFPELSEVALGALASQIEAKPVSEPSAEEEQTVVEASEILSRHGARTLPDGRGLEDILIGALESEQSKGLLGRLTGGKSFRTPAMRAAMIEALGGVGGEKSRKLLTNLGKDKDPAVKQSVQNALAKIGS